MEHMGRKADPLSVDHRSASSRGKLGKCPTLAMVGGSKAPSFRRARNQSSKIQSEAPRPPQRNHTIIKYGPDGKTGSPAGIRLRGRSSSVQTAACRELQLLPLPPSSCGPALWLALGVMVTQSPRQLLQLTSTRSTLFHSSPLASQ